MTTINTDHYVTADRELEEILGRIQVRFWVCPIPEHSSGGPPRQTVEWDGDVACCLYPGCLRRSDDPGRNSCECEVYDCAGGCCGGRCSCAWIEEEIR